MVTKECPTCAASGVKVKAEGTESKARALLAQHDLAAGHVKPERRQKVPFEHTCPEGHILIANSPEARDKLVQKHAAECDA